MCLSMTLIKALRPLEPAQKRGNSSAPCLGLTGFVQ
jgi:hypothetical protein